jgi:cell division protein FtsX
VIGPADGFTAGIAGTFMAVLLALLVFKEITREMRPDISSQTTLRGFDLAVWPLLIGFLMVVGLRFWLLS